VLGFTGALPPEGKYQVHRRYLLPVNPLSDALDFWLGPFYVGVWGALSTLFSNVGYRYLNFYHNPFHALAIALFFFSTMLLAMQGSAILSAVSRKRSVRDVDTINVFWRDLIGYSIGEIGIHKIAFYFAIAAVLLSDMCILFSGWLV